MSVFLRALCTVAELKTSAWKRMTFAMIGFVVAMSMSPSRGAEPAIPSNAEAAGQGYVEELNKASAKLWETNADIQNEAQRKTSVAQEEFDAVTKKLRDEYVAKLRTLKNQAIARRDQKTADLLEKKVQVLMQGAPRNTVQEFWQSSFEAEQVQDYKSAIEAVEKAIKTNGGTRNTFANLRLGWLHYLRKEYDKSISAYQAAARSAPRAVSPQLGLMNCYVAMDKPEEAMNAAKRILSRNPSDLTANSTLARLHYEKAEYEIAAEHYGALVSRYPENMEIWSRLAWCWAKQGKKDAARSVFLDVLAVEPNQLSALTGYGEVASLGASAEARKE